MTLEEVEDRAYLNLFAVAERVSISRQNFKSSMDGLCETLEDHLTNRGVEVEERELVERALALSRAPSAAFRRFPGLSDSGPFAPINGHDFIGWERSHFLAERVASWFASSLADPSCKGFGGATARGGRPGPSLSSEQRSSASGASVSLISGLRPLVAQK